MKKDYLVLILLFTLSIGCSVFFYQCKKSPNTISTSSAPQPGMNEVWIQNMSFIPASITVSVNTTVKWTNKDTMAHTVTSTTRIFDSGRMGSNVTFSYQFNSVGTYSYKCSIHPGMKGTVIVQ